MNEPIYKTFSSYDHLKTGLLAGVLILLMGGSISLYPENPVFFSIAIGILTLFLFLMGFETVEIHTNHLAYVKNYGLGFFRKRKVFDYFLVSSIHFSGTHTLKAKIGIDSIRYLIPGREPRYNNTNTIHIVFTSGQETKIETHIYAGQLKTAFDKMEAESNYRQIRKCNTIKEFKMP